MKISNMVAVLLTTLTLVACGSSQNQPASSTLTQSQHDALAQQFMTEATAEGLTFTLVKEDTLQKAYIIVYQPDPYNAPATSYMAIDVDMWAPGTSVTAFMSKYADNRGLNGTNEIIYDNVWTNNDGTYSVGVMDGSYQENNTVVYTFSVAQPTVKDLQKLAAFSQSYKLDAATKKVHDKYGLSLERSTYVAKLALAAKSKGRLTEADRDDLIKQLMGFDLKTLDAAADAAKRGDKSAQENLIGTAATTNGIGNEQARSLFNGFMAGAQ